MNIVHVAGHLGSDPEVRFTPSGQKVTNIRVAARVRRKGNDDTIWWRCTIWGEQFDKMIPYLKKGSPIIVSGEISKPEIFTNREGKSQVSMELTVTNLQFSPFGRSSDKQTAASETPSSMSNKTANDTERASDGAFQTTSAFSGISQGSGDDSLGSNSDEEIPF